MIWPFKPHAPLGLTQKVTCERLVEKAERFLAQRNYTLPAIVTPQDIDALIEQIKAEELPQQMFNFFASRMPSSGESVAVTWAENETLFVDGQHVHFDCLTDDNGRICEVIFDRSLADFPYRLAAIAATTVAQSLVWTDTSDAAREEGLCESIPLFFGAGAIMANAALHELSETYGNFNFSSWSRSGSVGAVEFGYMMALTDWSLGTNYAAISDQLRLDAQEGLTKGLRFLKKTTDCCIQQDFAKQSPDNSIRSLVSQLDARSDSLLYSTLIEIWSCGEFDTDLLPGVTRLLSHSDVEIQKLAARTLGKFGSLPRPIHDELVMLTANSPATVRRAAVSSLRPGYENDEQVVETLTELLRSGDAAMATNCIVTLLKYDSWPEHLCDCLLSGLSTMVLTSGNEELAAGVQLLHRVLDNPQQILQDHFADDPSALAIFNEILNGETQVTASED